ncbi:MAG: ABC transporter permease [Caldilineaceae bacterium]|nr:ABC transporter permease [Caldilineaceae bacterium]
MSSTRWSGLIRRHPYLFTLLLLLVAIGVNRWLQPNLFETRVLNGNLRTFTPLLILAAGQTIVIIGGGIDLSVGAIVSLVTAILVTQLQPDSGGLAFATVVAMGALAGMAAGAFNGFCVAFLRLQPIVTTYATSFLFSGLALWILPRPGGNMPQEIARFYRRTTPLGLPLGIYIAIVLVLLWVFLRSTRYGRYLFAVGGAPNAAYTTGIPVNWMRLSTYVIAGLMAAASALSLTLATSAGDPRVGDAMTLDSVVAVVLGGTRLSGGQGGVAGSIMGVIILGLIRNIISFADVPTWWQTLVDALIIVVALAGPGFVRLVRGRKVQ